MGQLCRNIRALVEKSILFNNSKYTKKGAVECFDIFGLMLKPHSIKRRRGNFLMSASVVPITFYIWVLFCVLLDHIFVWTGLISTL